MAFRRFGHSSELVVEPWVSDKDNRFEPHQLTAGACLWLRGQGVRVKNGDTRETKRDRQGRRASVSSSPSSFLGDTWEMNPAIVMFHLLQSHPKKYKAPLQLLQLAELLNPLLHHSNWMCARQRLAACQLTFCLSVCLFFSCCTQMQKFVAVFFLQPS